MFDKEIRQSSQSTIVIFEGARYIFAHKQYYKFIYIPIIINIILFIGLIFGLYSGLSALGAYIYSFIAEYVPNFIIPVLKFFFGLTALIAALYSFNTISSIVNSPVYEFLIESVFEQEKVPFTPIGNQFKQIMHDIGKAIKLELKKFFVFIIFVVIGLLVNLIPVVGPFLSIAIAVINFILFNGLSLYEPIMSRYHLGFRQQLSLLWKQKAQYWPNIGLSGFLITIPVVNIFTLPFAIAGSIIHFMELQSKQSN